MVVSYFPTVVTNPRREPKSTPQWTCFFSCGGACTCFKSPLLVVTPRTWNILVVSYCSTCGLDSLFLLLKSAFLGDTSCLIVFSLQLWPVYPLLSLFPLKFFTSALLELLEITSFLGASWSTFSFVISPNSSNIQQFDAIFRSRQCLLKCSKCVCPQKRKYPVLWPWNHGEHDILHPKTFWVSRFGDNLRPNAGCQCAPKNNVLSFRIAICWGIVLDVLGKPPTIKQQEAWNFFRCFDRSSTWLWNIRGRGSSWGSHLAEAWYILKFNRNRIWGFLMKTRVWHGWCLVVSEKMKAGAAGGCPTTPGCTALKNRKEGVLTMGSAAILKQNDGVWNGVYRMPKKSRLYLGRWWKSITFWGSLFSDKIIPN